MIPSCPRICSTPNCGEKRVGRGYCLACYRRALRRGLFVVGSPTNPHYHRLTCINEEAVSAICSICGPVHIQHRGGKGGRTKSGKIRWRCANTIKAKYRISPSKFKCTDGTPPKLGNICEICGKTSDEEYLCLDHCHRTGYNRGTLCTNCNTSIGLLKDDITIMQSAINYLKTYDTSKLPTWEVENPVGVLSLGKPN